MNVFEFAMQMEKDGEAFYREIARGTKNPGLKKIFETLADEEVVHFNTFKKLAEKSEAKVVESNILAKANNIFAEMKEGGAVDLSDETPQVEAYRKAMAAEEEAYTFYEKKAAECSEEAEKEALLVFAKEERRHYHLLENVLEFVSRPETWIEDGEFINIEEY
ncbi:MAG: ferritin family protein [Desulfocapsaceae bacterium]|nr:ferritin family protein [Desulfocapsaceae bacterium]